MFNRRHHQLNGFKATLSFTCVLPYVIIVVIRIGCFSHRTVYFVATCLGVIHLMPISEPIIMQLYKLFKHAYS